MRKSYTIDFFKKLPHKDMTEETEHCENMWRAVIDVMTEDLINPVQTKEDETNRKAAEFWLANKTLWDSTQPGFIEVCELAGLDPKFVRTNIDCIRYLRHSDEIDGKRDAHERSEPPLAERIDQAIADFDPNETEWYY